MQPRNLAVVDAPVVLDALVLAAGALDALVALAAGVVELLAVDELVPHAATSRVAAPAAAAVINAVCLTISSTGPRFRRPGMTGAPESD
jgi:hypothetical protein